MQQREVWEFLRLTGDRMRTRFGPPPWSAEGSGSDIIGFQSELIILEPPGALRAVATEHVEVRTASQEEGGQGRRVIRLSRSFLPTWQDCLTHRRVRAPRPRHQIKYQCRWEAIPKFWIGIRII